MEIYDPLKKENRPFTGEDDLNQDNPENLISGKASSHEYTMGFCLKMTFRFQFVRVLLSSLGFIVFLALLNLLFFFDDFKQQGTLKFYILFDVCLFVLDFLLTFFMTAFRLKKSVQLMQPTYLEIYKDYLQVKDRDQSGKTVFRLPFSNFIQVIFFKEAYVLVFHTPSGMKSSLIVSKASIQESAIDEVEKIFEDINLRNEKN